MDVIIKDMVMPKCCNECILCDCNFNDENGEEVTDWMCLAKMKFCEKNMKVCRPKWCPLEEG